jgi:hypothetical protein
MGQMGHTNYEVEFDEQIEWDDEFMKSCLEPFAQHLYLRDLDKPRLMLCVHSQDPVEDILVVLKGLYSTGLRYRIYKSTEWTTFTVWSQPV